MMCRIMQPITASHVPRSEWLDGVRMVSLYGKRSPITNLAPQGMCGLAQNTLKQSNSDGRKSMELAQSRAKKLYPHSPRKQRQYLQRLKEL